MIEKETKDIYDYVIEMYELVVKTYLQNEKLDRDIDDMFNKFDDIILDICFDFIQDDDLAEQLIMGNLNNLTDFAYYMDYLGIELKLIELIEEPRKYCNFYLTDLLWCKLGDVLTDKLEYKIEDFQNEYTEKCQNLDDKEVEEFFRKMVKDTLLNEKERLIGCVT